MDARIENGNLVIELKLEKPRPSATGKTLLVASTRGVHPSTVRIKGSRVSIVANAFIYPDVKVKEQRVKPSTVQEHQGEEDEY